MPRFTSSAYSPSKGTKRIPNSVVLGGSMYLSWMSLADCFTRESSTAAAASTAAGSLFS